MDCKQAEQLFDAYLDGELSPSLSTELGAHRLACSNCRRALALLEVTGHIVSADRDPHSLTPEFTDRLLACVDAQQNGPWAKWRHRLYVGAPLTAAAVIVLAFAGFFDGTRKQKVAGEQEVNRTVVSGSPSKPADKADEEPVGPVDEAALAEWLRRTEHNVQSKKEGGESLQRALDSTLEQVLDVLESEAADSADSKPKPPSPPVGGKRGDGGR